MVLDDLTYKATVKMVEHRNDGVVELWLDVAHMHPSNVEDLRDGPWVEGSGPPPCPAGDDGFPRHLSDALRRVAAGRATSPQRWMYGPLVASHVVAAASVFAIRLHEPETAGSHGAKLRAGNPCLPGNSVDGSDGTRTRGLRIDSPML